MLLLLQIAAFCQLLFLPGLLILQALRRPPLRCCWRFR